jgi:isoquinoline 1-oxidoreductase beta subunit
MTLLDLGIENVSRRRFLGGLFSTGAFVVASQVFPESAFAQDPNVKTRAQSAALNPSVYLGIEPDGTVFIVTHRSEMGTGIRTSLPLVAADELDADWGRVRIEQGLGDTKYGDQNTDGSRSIRDFYDAFRRAGASAKSMLVTAAAQQWNVPAAQITVANHEVIHAASNRRLGFGALVPAAAKLPVPKAEDLRFKAKDQWKFVGRERPIYDLGDITTGKAPFGLDIYREGMLFASIEHPPVVRGTVASLDDSETRKVRGVQETVTLDPMKGAPNFQPLGGVAVIGNSTWAVLQGRKKLKVTWNDGPNAGFDSTTFKQTLIKTAQSPAKVVRKIGDVDAEFAKGGKVLEATYSTPMLAHAAMEPPAAVADFRNGKVEVWTPTQNPQAAQETVAAALGIKKEDVTCHVTLLGGGFGRKSKPDFAAEAAVLSKKLGKPVKVIWTREDDLKHDFYHAAAAVYHKAAVDAKGKPTAWLYRSVFQPIASTFVPNANEPLGFELDMGMTDMPYDVPNLRGENGKADANVRIGWFRAVTNNFHVFASGSFVDEMAHAAGRDPLEFLLDLLGPGKNLDLKAQGVDYSNYGAPLDKYPVDTRRLRKVLEVAAEKAGWAKRRAPRLQQLRRVGGGGGGRQPGRLQGAAHRAGDRCRPHREPRSRAHAARGRGRDGRGPGA